MTAIFALVGLFVMAYAFLGDVLGVAIFTVHFFHTLTVILQYPYSIYTLWYSQEKPTAIPKSIIRMKAIIGLNGDWKGI